MRTARVGAGLLAGCLVVWGGASQAQAQSQAATMLKYRPRQDNVLLSTPAASEIEACKVEPVKGSGKGAGWALRDPQGRPLRRFYDTTYDGSSKGNIDVWSYYHEGVETYREAYLNTREAPDQMHYRWLNTGGSRWGIDVNKDGKIDSWKMISPEEVSQEALRAVASRDLARLQALLITDAEIKALELPAEMAQRLRDRRRGVEAKFQATVAKLTSLGEKTQWLHVELGAPQCVLLEGGREMIRYAGGTVLCETGGKSEWLQLGEMIQVAANSWRLADAPTPGGEGGAGTTVAENAELQKLLKDLGELDSDWSKKQAGGAGAPTDVAKYNLDRTNLIEKIVAVVKPEEREQWVRQAADCLAAAAQASGSRDTTAAQRLSALVAQLEKTMPAGSPLIAYVTFRDMQADYGAKISDPNQKDPAKVQQEWLERLAKFVKSYPNADDTPDALLSLGWGSEMGGKEIEAKNWYTQLARDFGSSVQAAKARGAMKRLELEGKPLELSGSLLGGGNYDVASARGKVVVVYYWASWNGQSAGDFDKLKQLIEKHGKELELVTVNLDTSTEEAQGFVKRTSAPGTHLHLPGGLESKLATDYGVMMLPNVFLVDKEGKVVNRTIQVAGLADELKKLLK